MTQSEFYHSTPWRKCRDAYVKQRLFVDGGLCEVCHQHYGKIVHHKKWLNDINVNDPDIALNVDNLRYECQDCHNKEAEPGKGSAGRCNYDEDGNLIFKS